MLPSTSLPSMAVICPAVLAFPARSRTSTEKVTVPTFSAFPAVCTACHFLLEKPETADTVGFEFCIIVTVGD